MHPHDRPTPPTGGPPAPAGWRYNPPPTWPPPPPGWIPPTGWHPDPSWPPPPQNWRFWIPDVPTTPPPQMPVPATPHMAPPPHAQAAKAPVFGKKQRIEDLEAENSRLRQELARLGGLEAWQITSEIERLRGEATALRQQLVEESAQLAQARRTIVETEDVALLQEAGLYEYRHPLADAVAYKAELARLKDSVKAMVRADRAVDGDTSWTVNGSATEGRKMVREQSRLMLRAFNAEADNLVRTMRPYKLESSITRLEKSAQTIERLGRTMRIRITQEYRTLRVRELALTADHLAKVEEEKERVRAERERRREEEKAQREFEKEKARLLKERSHVVSVLDRLRAKGDEGGAADLEAKLADVESAITSVESREANVRAGYVYVISNVGAFGERVVKIGLTRRLEPMDRVRELGDASVPFRFDVHALIFSEDAVGLENRLHQEFAAKRVNRVNQRREFFYATPADVREALERLAGNHLLEYTETPEALEWRASESQRSAAPAVT
ncbi:DUF4041 domain-containing protein [Actinomadura harenae]|uniref:DUF4041 domain-containing protein n=1 Tax=Actinomadura harenae TaxID=2483351 RepID=A0A3M2M464_9ACTN|nr:DUF4041 domain-containing protein [Actinomadura harenae]RMI44356.1 DUF4041 domain-containing protein [Actinomadura harenae]